ncbi:MAG: hypothetical protein R3F49_22965 [Planctomycetota bacterium]
MSATTFTRAALTLGALAPAAAAQSTYLFSIDWQGPTVGLVDPSGVAITEGDILMPTTSTLMPALGPLPVPTIAVPHAPTGLGLFPGCIGHPGGTPCVVEVDALSFGLDQVFQPGVVIPAGQILFSVDEFAATGPSPFNPSVGSEAPAFDAGADAFVNMNLLPGLGFSPFPGAHVAVQDGDGIASGSGFAYPGVGVRESNPPFPGVPDIGDNVDALDVVPFPPAAGLCDVFYSLDAAFLDILEGVPHTGSAAFHGFVGGDILTTPCGTVAPTLWAPANALGLDLVGGPDSDDLDALILHENGVNGAQIPGQLWQWINTTLPSDMILFSVRRGSAVIGMPDSLLGIPIEEGDLLVPPITGGLSPYPGIAIPAEALGLGTVRSGTAFPGNDLDAADALLGPLFDCDGDGLEDAVAIALGVAVDANLDGIPDACQMNAIGTPFCFCNTVAPAPCGNVFPTGGCLNASATGAILTGTGSTSVSLDNLVLTTTGMNPSTFALTVRSLNPFAPTPIQNGLICLQNTIYRLPPYATSPTGVGSIGPGIVFLAATWNPPAGWIFAGQTWNFQTWYRDFGGPCGGFSNFSNALAVTFTP